jgi:FAD/FMN-containing dehydrogenase
MRTQNDKLNAYVSNELLQVSPVNSLHLPLLANKTVLKSWSGLSPTETFLMPRREDVLAIVKNDKVPFIARGAGRRFGDVAYLTDGMTLSSLEINNIIALDLQEGKMVCEAGVRMGTLHLFLDPLAWSFPCYGGTQWVTLGGAVAADINSKNDVSQGSFGNHVDSLLVMTPNGQEVACSREVNRELFHATIGGMGLTGFIKRVTLKTTRCTSCALTTSDCMNSSVTGTKLMGKKASSSTTSSCQPNI